MDPLSSGLRFRTLKIGLVAGLLDLPEYRSCKGFGLE